MTTWRTLPLHTLLLLALFGFECSTEDIPEGDPDEIGRVTDGYIRFTENEFADESSAEPLTAETRIESAERFARRVYLDCQQQASHPELLGAVAIPRPLFETCPAVESDTLTPGVAATCAEAVCGVVAALCVAERLYAISRQVDDYQSSRYPVSDEHVELLVPPQSAQANARLTEVAADWAAQALRMSGENLRSGLSVSLPSSVPGEGACTDDPGDGRDFLFDSRNVASDVFGESAARQPYAEVLLAGLFEGAQL